MTRYAKKKLKYSLNENLNLLLYVEWDRFVTLTGAQADWGLRYRIYSDHQIDIIEYVNVAHSIGSESLFKITGTCGQESGPYGASDCPSLLFFNINFFSCTQHFSTFYVSLYDIYIQKKNNQAAVSIHTGFLTYA